MQNPYMRCNTHTTAVFFKITLQACKALSIMRAAMTFVYIVGSI